MENCRIRVYYGPGTGKTSAALGNALLAAGSGKTVVIIQFLKSKELKDYSVLKRMEPEIKLFRFEKKAQDYCNLTPEAKEAEIRNIKNGLGFARKVLSTGECDLLIMDEILGLFEYGILTVDEFLEMCQNASDPIRIILTGRVLDPQLEEAADELYRIDVIKKRK